MASQCRRRVPGRFRCGPGRDNEHEAVVVSVEFLNDREGEAFARRFDRKEPPGSTPRGV